MWHSGVAGSAELGWPLGLDGSNWDRPPFSPWSFTNIQALFPTVPVPKASQQSSFSGPPERAANIGLRGAGGERTTLDDFLSRSHTNAFWLSVGSRVLVEEYRAPMGPAILHLSMSLSKSLVGVLAGILVDQQALDPDEQVETYIPEASRSGYAGSSLRHLLDMTSGVRFSEAYGDPRSEVWAMDVATGWRPRAHDHEPRSLRALMLGLEKNRNHGERFEYRSMETDVLAWVLERVSGVPLPELIASHLWEPLGCEADACLTVDSEGVALASGGFAACLRDYARFGKLIADGGSAGGRQIVSEAWLSDIWRSGRSGSARFPDWMSADGYRNQFWVDTTRGIIMARGIYGQLIYIAPATGTVAVKLSSWPECRMPDLLAETLDVIPAVADQLRS